MDNEVIKSKKKLIDKEFYVSTNNTGVQNGNIFQYCSKLKDGLYYTGGFRSSFDKNGGSFVPPYKKANLEESHWLKEMIKQDKFISYEKAMETFTEEKLYDVSTLTPYPVDTRNKKGQKAILINGGNTAHPCVKKDIPYGAIVTIEDDSSIPYISYKGKKSNEEGNFCVNIKELAPIPEESTSLVGRYFTPLERDINCSDCKVGEYYKIVEEEDTQIWYYDGLCRLYINKSNLNKLTIMSSNWSPTEEINTYGLKVGDILKSNNINEWSTINKEYNDKKWRNPTFPFNNDRKIESFKLLDGIVGFEVSGTTNIFLKAEGFKEFAESFEKSNTIPEYVECTQWAGYSHIKGNIYKVEGDYIIDEKGGATNFKQYFNSHFKSSTLDAYNLQNKPKEMSKEELLEKAKRDYPKDTHFKCAFVPSNIRYSSADFYWVDSNLRVKTKIDVNEDYLCSNFVYHNGKWAEIISLPKEEVKEYIPQVGDWVVIRGTRNGNGSGNGIDEDTIIAQLLKRNTKFSGHIYETTEFSIKYGKQEQGRNIRTNCIIRKAKPEEIPNKVRSENISSTFEYVDSTGMLTIDTTPTKKINTKLHTVPSIFRFNLEKEEQSPVEVQKLNINIFKNIKKPLKLNNYGN